MSRAWNGDYSTPTPRPAPVLMRPVNERLTNPAMATEKPNRIASALTALDGVAALELYGRVSGVRGLLIEVAGPVAAMHLGGRLDIDTGRGFVPCEVIGFAG